MGIQAIPMSTLGQPYSYARWEVKQGSEAAFVAAWAEFAHWTALNVPGSQQGLLLQDMGRPNIYISIGPWMDMESVSSWRSREEFKRFFAMARELGEDITPATLKLVVTSD